MTARRTIRVVTSALVAGACVALTGCSAGQLTQTATQVSAVPGVNVTVGSIALRDLKILYNGSDGYQAGDNAPMEIRIFNDGTKPVTLTGVTADGAQAVTLVGSPGATASPAPTTPVSPSPATSPSPDTSPSPATSPSPEASPATPPSPGASPSPEASPAPSAAPPTSSQLSIQIPPQSYVLLVPEQGSYLQLTGLTQAVGPGDEVRVTFTFDNGASVPIEIPLVAPPGITVPRATPVVEGGHE